MENVNIYKKSEILVTSNYCVFKKLEGNRDALDTRVAKIVSSIKKIGYVPVPIVVNERYEVIDGNGRLTALKQLGLPVFFMVVPGLRLEDCISMNINSTNWSLQDYIYSHASRGNDSYRRLVELQNKYKELGIAVITAAATNTVGGVDHTTIKSGNLRIDETAAINADASLTWLLENFCDMRPYIVGRFDHFLCALLFIYRNTSADIKRLTTTIKAYKNAFPPVVSIKDTVKQISNLYNRGLKKNKVYLDVEYDMWNTENTLAYEARWGKKKDEKQEVSDDCL